MNKQRMLSQRGQTMVEYMLLLAVVVSLVYTFYNSEAYKRLFGSQGVLAKTMKEEMEYSYRQALSRNPNTTVPAAGERDITQFPSYQAGAGETRFFGPKVKYP